MKHTLQIDPPAVKNIKGEVVLTGSKSISNRVLVIHALAHGTFNIENLSDARDTTLMQQALENRSGFLDVGAGGTTYRFLTAYLACREGDYILTGSDRMKERPIRVLVDALRDLGAGIEYLEQEGYPPLRIHGRLDTGGTVRMAGDVSSQYLTALLLIAPTLKGGLVLEWTGHLVSRPYVMMTLNLMEHFGAEWEMTDNRIIVKEGHYVPRDFYVEGDWSAASYYYAIAALGESADITLYGLESDSVQGDAVIAYLMESFNVVSTYDARSKSVRLTKSAGELPRDFTYDFIECPDLAQTVASAMTALKVDSVFSGLKTLKIKETDRVEALEIELRKFGAVFKETGADEWILDCKKVSRPEHRPIIRTYEDHRMAMALAPLCLAFGQLIIENPDVVAKSYPNFWKDMASLGFRIS